MKIGITKFPGTNNEQDVTRVLNCLNVENELLYPRDYRKLKDFDALILAGGFSYGDYLRAGVVAARTSLIDELHDFIISEKFVLGICNGFQMLCEANYLSGVLTTNTSTRFISKWVNIKVNKTNSPLLKGLESKVMRIPIAHYEGNYYNTEESIKQLENNSQIAFQYCNEKEVVDPMSNPNGSIANIAGIVNNKGNILGMMPHPERASFSYLGSIDGRSIFENLIEELRC